MSKMIIENGVTIDVVENVLIALENYGHNVLEPEIIKHFIIYEKNTKFYITDKLKSSMESNSDSRYLWMDTGFRDKKGNPIFVSLKKRGSEYVGHMTGNFSFLIGRLRDEFYYNRKHINDNTSTLKAKYEKKAAARSIEYIDDEQQYYIDHCNKDNSHQNEFAKAFSEIDMGDLPENEVCEDACEEIVAMDIATEELGLEDYSRDELTIGIILEQMSKMQARLDELVEIIAEKEAKDNETIEKLRIENENYRRSLNNIREFTHIEEKKESSINNGRNQCGIGTGYCAHDLLDRHKKILVLGATSVGDDILQAIAKKDYGFSKNDFVFETDYEKITNAAGRLQNADKYQAVILGKMPHKVSKLGCWSSLCAKFSQAEYGPYTIEAHNNAGELIINKESFRKALNAICEYLKEKQEVA